MDFTDLLLVFDTILLVVWIITLVFILQSVRKIVGRIERTVNRMELTSVNVADDLADSYQRASSTEGPPGAAADAAFRAPNGN